MALDPNATNTDDLNMDRFLERAGEYIFHVHEFERQVVRNIGPSLGNEMLVLHMVVVDGEPDTIGKRVLKSYQLQGDAVRYLFKLCKDMGAGVVRDEYDDRQVTDWLCWKPFLGRVAQREGYFNLVGTRRLTPAAVEVLQRTEYNFKREGLPENLMIRDRRREGGRTAEGGRY